MQADVAVKVSDPVECKGAFFLTIFLKGCLVVILYLALVHKVFQDCGQSPVSFGEISFVRSLPPKSRG